MCFISAFNFKCNSFIAEENVDPCRRTYENIGLSGSRFDVCNVTATTELWLSVFPVLGLRFFLVGDSKYRSLGSTEGACKDESNGREERA